MKIWIVLILISLSSLQAAERPSWCSGAKYQAEHIICQNEKFWELEERLMQAYRDAKERLDSESFAAVKRDQREWVKERNSFDSKWMSIKELVSDYKRRIVELEEYEIITVFKNLTYDVDGKKITLRDGVYRDGNEKAFIYYGFDEIVTKGDLTGDGKNEYIISIGMSGGGSGIWSSLCVMQERYGVFVTIGEIFLDDREYILSSYIKNRRFYATVQEHGPNDASCCPSLKKNHEWKLVGKELQKIK
jgi:uncharacterized protein